MAQQHEQKPPRNFPGQSQTQQLTNQASAHKLSPNDNGVKPAKNWEGLGTTEFKPAHQNQSTGASKVNGNKPPTEVKRKSMVADLELL